MDVSEIHGALVCSSKPTKTGDVPPWGMYLAGFICFGLGILFLAATADSLFDTRPGAARAAIVGVSISLVMGLVGVAAIVAGVRTRRLDSVRFYQKGLLLGPADSSEFFPYQTLEAISIQIREPTEAKKAAATSRAIISLLVGNWAGVGMTIGSTRSNGHVQFILPDELKDTSIELPLADLMCLADIVGPIRGETVVKHVAF